MGEPFLSSEALAAGRLTRHQLRTKFVAVHQDVYVSADTELTPLLRANACWLRSRRRGVLVGFSASASSARRQVDQPPSRPAEINDTNHKPTRGVIARGGLIGDDAGLPEVRAGCDDARTHALGIPLCCVSPDTAIPAVDALARATRLKIADVELLAERHRGRRGIRRARTALDLVDDGAESPRRNAVAAVDRQVRIPETADAAPGRQRIRRADRRSRHGIRGPQDRVRVRGRPVAGRSAGSSPRTSAATRR